MTTKKKPTYGGARPGSGPKRKLEDARVVYYVSDAPARAYIEKYAKKHKITKSAAARALIHAGWKASL